MEVSRKLYASAASTFRTFDLYVRQGATASRTQYSVVRLASFQNYRAKATSKRIVKAMVISTLPMCVLMCVLNLVPLNNPREGLGSNYIFFARNYVGTVVAAVGARLQREYLLHVQMPWKYNFAIANVGAALHTVMYWVTAKLFRRFPVPFAPLVALPLAFAVILALALLLMRHRQTTKQGDASAFKTYKRLMLFECSLLISFSMFTFGFHNFNGIYKLAYTLLLPTLKYTLSVVLGRLLTNTGDVTAEIEVFSIRFFSSMYMSMWLGSTTDLGVTLTLMAVDVFHMVLGLIELNYRAHLLATAYNDAFGGGGWKRQDLIMLCLRFANEKRDTLTQLNARFDVSSDPITRWTWFKQSFRWPMRSTVAPIFSSPQTASKTQLIAVKQDLPAQVAPASVQTGPQPPTEPTRKSSERNVQLISQLLEFMFSMERMVLIEFVEAFVPIFYDVYVLTTFFSDNGKYVYGILEFETQTRMFSAVRSVLVYGTLEWLSLVLLWWFIKRRFGINVFSVLAFVLETHFYNIQGKIMFLMMIILNLKLVHYGMDFDFRFEFTGPL